MSPAPAPPATELSLSYPPGGGNPSPFYEKLGFVSTGEGELVEDEFTMRFKL